MDLAILQKVAHELNEFLPGGFINKIHQPLPREIVLRVRVPRENEKRVMISADPLLGSIHITDLKIPNPPSPPRFCAYLRAHLQGATVRAVSCASDDRVVRIESVRGSRQGATELDLILELLGRDSNILLIDRQSGRIKECLHRIPDKEMGNRVVLPGYDYHPPPKPTGSPRPAIGSWDPAELSPGVAVGSNGKKRLTLTAIPGRDETFPTMNEAADKYYGSTLSSTLIEGLRRNLAAPLKARIRSLDRRMRKIEGDRKRLADLALRQEEGELLKANLGRVEKGMRRIEVHDWNTARARLIELDPARSGVENMERIFNRAAKGKRGEKPARKRLRLTLEEKRAMEDLLFFVESAPNVEELNRLASEIPFAPVRGKSKDLPEKTRKERTGGTLFREFRTPGGRVALVGKSGKGNDFLLRKKARKGDLWFHVQGTAGAHVLLPRREQGAPSDADREFAARLAVHFSRARGKGRVDVMVADVKDVRRTKGTLPGQVNVAAYATMRSEGVDPKNEEDRFLLKLLEQSQ